MSEVSIVVRSAESVAASVAASEAASAEDKRTVAAGTTCAELFEDRAIVEHVVGMADALGMKTVAEGVEREAQREALAVLACDCYQGFLCSPAVPAPQFAEKVRADMAFDRGLT